MEKYLIVNGTSYYYKTDPQIIKILEELRQNKTRIILKYGDENGETCNDVSEMTGRIGRSSGKIKIPVLVHNLRSIGGRGILTDRIVKIVTSKGKKVIYQQFN